eukprot:g1779.t1
MPSSPVVCCLRREIARRIDALAKEEDTPPGVANGDGRQREDRGIRELGAEHVPTAPRFKYGDADSNGGSSRPLNNGGGDSSLPADEESREYSGASANWWAGRSGMLHSTSVRPGVAASGEAASDIGNTALTRWVKRPEEFSKTSLRDELGGQISDARSNSSNSSNTSSNTSSSSSEPAQGLDGMRRALAELDGRDSTREAAQRAPERERHAVEFPRIPSRSNNKRRGYSNRSSRPDDGEPRARTVRFLLEEKKEETNVNGVAIGEAVEGVSQTTQKKGRSLGGDCLPTMANSKSSPLLKMRRSLMDSYNETVRSAPKAIDRTCQLEPGPGHYKLAIVNPQEDNAPKYTFPKDTGAAVRENVVRAPGPGHYNIHPGVGKQVLSTKRSYAGVGFGTGNRPDMLVQSTADVGPGEYSIPGSTGERQVDSRKCNKSGAKFSKASRMGKSGSLEDVVS